MSLASPFPRDGEGVGWAGGRVHTPSRVPHPWGATSYREVALLTYVLASVQVHVFVHHSALPVRSEAALWVVVHAEAADTPRVHEMMEVLREQRRELEKMDTMVDDLAATGRLTPALTLTAAKA